MEKIFWCLYVSLKPGGLCRSLDVGGSPFDISGGHLLDVNCSQVNEFLFGFIPEEEWDLYNRDSRIVVNGNVVNHRIGASIWQMKLEDQVEYLKSFAVAGLNLEVEMPLEFVDWIYWKLGSKVLMI